MIYDLTDGESRSALGDLLKGGGVLVSILTAPSQAGRA
jgi:hypothetical protein